jgi:hypothetical protein
LRCWLNDTLESDVFSRNDDAPERDAAPVRSMLLRTNCDDADADVAAAALPAPDPAPVAGAIGRPSHVLRQPVMVVADFAISEAGSRLAGDPAVGVGAG